MFVWHDTRGLVCSSLEDWPSMVGEWSLPIHALFNNLDPYVLCSSLIDPAPNTLFPSGSSALHSAEAPFTYTIGRDTYGRRCSPKDALFISTRVLSVRRGQSSCEELPPPPECLKVNHRTEGGIDWRLNDPEECSGGGGSLPYSRRGFCLAQPAKSAPQLLSVNRFTVLNIEETNTDTSELIDVPITSTPDRKVLSRKPKWEKRLPKWLSINTLDTHRTSIVLPIEISTTNTSEVHSIKMLLDSGAMGNFINKDFVCMKGMSTQSISHPIPVYNMDSVRGYLGSYLVSSEGLFY